jgi:hypothetical protein
MRKSGKSTEPAGNNEQNQLLTTIHNKALELFNKPAKIAESVGHR